LIHGSAQYERVFGLKPLVYRLLHRYDDVPKRYLEHESKMSAIVCFGLITILVCNLVAGNFPNFSSGFLFFGFVVVFIVGCLFGRRAKSGAMREPLNKYREK
jgi:hypothetical protein